MENKFAIPSDLQDKQKQLFRPFFCLRFFCLKTFMSEAWKMTGN